MNRTLSNIMTMQTGLHNLAERDGTDERFVPRKKRTQSLSEELREERERLFGTDSEPPLEEKRKRDRTTYSKTYYQRNRNKARLAHQRYVENNREKVRDHQREYVRKYRADKRAAEYTNTDKDPS